MDDKEFNPRQRALIASQARAQLVGMTGAMPCQVWRPGEDGNLALIGEGIAMFDGPESAERTAAKPDAGVVAVVEPSSQASFTVQSGDLVMAMPGLGIVIPYTVAGPVQGSEAEWPFLRSWRLQLDSELLQSRVELVTAVTVAA